MSVKLLLKANANFGNFCFNHDLNKETIIYNCTGNKDKIFIDNNSFHSRNRLSNVPDTQSFVVRANSFNCFPSIACMWPTEAGKVFSRLVLFIEFISTVCIFVRAQRERISYRSCQK